MRPQPANRCCAAASGEVFTQSSVFPNCKVKDSQGSEVSPSHLIQHFIICVRFTCQTCFCWRVTSLPKKKTNSGASERNEKRKWSHTTVWDIRYLWWTPCLCEHTTSGTHFRMHGLCCGEVLMLGSTQLSSFWCHLCLPYVICHPAFESLANLDIQTWATDVQFANSTRIRAYIDWVHSRLMKLQQMSFSGFGNISREAIAPCNRKHQQVRRHHSTQVDVSE